MSEYLGDYPVNAVIEFKWDTFAAAGESITRATDGTLKIYKGNSTTERSSLAGVTQTEDFDTTTGLHHVTIDTSDNTDAGFYAAGNEYQVVMAGMVIDGKTVNKALRDFSIERANGVLALLKGANGLAAIKTDTAGVATRASQASVDVIDTNVDSILADTGTDGVVVAPGSKTGYELSAAGVDAIHDEAVDGVITMRQSQRLQNSAAGGRVSGMATTSVAIRDLADTKDRISATVDADGNRTAVTRDLT